jgi:enoyl-CoA hydratase
MASYLLLSGEQIGAEEAKQANLIEKVFAPDQLMPEAIKLAKTIAAKGPLAVAATKRLIHKGMQTDLHSALELEAAEFGKISATKDAKEGTKAFLEKRPANFKGD